jgi:predicted nucleic acid-binding protein
MRDAEHSSRHLGLDTSVYISMLREDSSPSAVDKSVSESALWLSAVVLEELYAGANDRQRKAVASLERDFDRQGRIVVPNLDDWVETGNILARLTAKYGYEQIDRGRLTHDALIAMSAARLDLKVITANVGDFERLCELRPFAWQLAGT